MSDLLGSRDILHPTNFDYFHPRANFSRVNGTPLNYANITDVPSYSWSYASILAAEIYNSLTTKSIRARPLY